MYVDFNHNDLANDETSSQKVLAEAVGFDDADLELNKAGKLSTPQATRLSLHVLGPFVGLVSTAIGLVSLGVALYVAGPAVIENSRLVLAVGKYLMLGIGALFFGLLAFVVKLIVSSGRVFLFMGDLMEGTVASVSGRMNTSKSEVIEDGLSTITRQKTSTLSCVIKGEYFGVNEETHAILLDRSGSQYCAYVTPRSRYMVAIEPSVAGARDPFKLEYKSAS